MLFLNIRADMSRLSRNGSFLTKLKICLISHTFHLVLLYRIGKYMSKIPVVGGVLRVFFESIIRIVYSSDISLKSKIGPGLVIIHGHDIVIGGSVCIGCNCKILNGVTLGNKDTESPINQQPTLGDNVVVGSGAKILGQIKIGDNVVVGANSVVINNVPDNNTAVGVPSRNVGNGS